MFRENRCVKCWLCVSACRQGAISRSGDELLFDRAKCNRCGDCVQVCASEARELVGRQVSAPEVVREVEKDIAFYDESGGGVTFSGGEPLMQSAFLLALVKSCKERELHTAVDTTGLTGWKILQRVAEWVDLFLYDLKLMDDARHRHYTGVSNRVILQNLAALAARPGSVLVRVPLIAGINDDAENIARMGQFLAGLTNPPPVSLLSYHKAGMHKYARLGRTYALPEAEPPSPERVAWIAETLREQGLQVTIGG